MGVVGLWDMRGWRREGVDVESVMSESPRPVWNWTTLILVSMRGEGKGGSTWD